MPRKKSVRVRTKPTLTQQEILLILCFLQEHQQRAERGLGGAMEALRLHPANAQFQGMSDHFSKMLTVIKDMGNYLEGRQRWVPEYRRLLAEMGDEPCQPPT